MKNLIVNTIGQFKRFVWKVAVFVGTSFVGSSLTANELAVGASQEIHANVEQLVAQDIVGPFVKLALHHNPTLRAADTQFQAAKASVKSAGVLSNPKIQLTHFIESIQTRTGPQEQALMLQQGIPWPSKLFRKKDIAKAQSEVLWQATIAEQFKLVNQVAVVVLDIAYKEKALQITQNQLVLLNQLEAIVRTRVESGGDLSQLLRLQVESAKIEDDIAKQNRLIASKVAELDALSGLEGNKKRLNLKWQPPKPLVEDGSLWLRFIGDNAPQIKMLRALESSHEARLRLAKLINRPDFTVGINRISTGDAQNPSMQGSGTDPWAVMVGISLPLWQKANNAKTRQTKLSKQAVSAQIIALELTLRSKGKGHILALEDEEQRLKRYQQNILPLAKQAREIAEASYLAGKTDINSVIDSDRALLNLQQRYWRSAANVWLARWKLATLSGGLWLN